MRIYLIDAHTYDAAVFGSYAGGCEATQHRVPSCTVSRKTQGKAEQREFNNHGNAHIYAFDENESGLFFGDLMNLMVPRCTKEYVMTMMVQKWRSDGFVEQ